MKKIILLAMLCCSQLIVAQQPTFEWARAYGDYQSGATSVAVDSNGNVFTCGIFKNTGDFDSSSSNFNLTANGDNEFYVTKYDASGTFIWAKSFGATATASSNNDSGIKLALDNLGNVFLSGTFYGIGDFDPGAGTAMVTSTMFSSTYFAGNFILKLDASGNFVWVKKITAFLNCTSDAVVIDANNEIYFVGNFSFSADLDPGPANFPVSGAGNSSIYIVKLNANGDFVWGKTIANNNGEQEPKNLKVDSNDNVYLSGSYRNTLDLDPSAAVFNVTSNGEKDFFLLKLDSAGLFVWGKSIGGQDNDNVSDISLDNSGNLYVVGTFLFTVDFDPGASNYPLTTTQTSFNNYALKLDTSGNFNWALRLSDAPKAPTVANDATGNVYIFSGFNYLFGTFDANPGAGNFPMTTDPDNDLYFVKLDTNGNFLTAFNYGDGDYRIVTDVVVDSSNKIYYCGFFDQGGAIDPLDLNPFSGQNAFYDTTASYTVKLAQPSLNITSSSINTFSIFPNPASKNLNLKFEDNLENVSLKVVSLTGQTMLEKRNLSGLDFNFDVSGLNSGLYFIEIKSNEGTFTSKFVKQ